MIHRRSFLEMSAAGAVMLAWGRRLRAAAPLKVGMCNWSMRVRDTSVFALAKRIGLDGVQMDLGFEKEGLPLRRAEVRREYKDAAREAGIAIPSTNIGELNRHPLAGEPRTAIWALDSIEAARDLGSRVSMLPFFGKGELRENEPGGIDAVVDVLKEIAPRAEKAGIILGLENTLSAEANLKILDRVGSPAVQVWYDVGNSDVRNYDVPAEIRLLGKRICQFHLKDRNFLLGQGPINFEAVARAIRDIGYDGWLILETASPKDVVEDTRANVAFTRRVFGLAARL